MIFSAPSFIYVKAYSSHRTLAQCRPSAGPAFTTLDQRCAGFASLCIFQPEAVFRSHSLISLQGVFPLLAGVETLAECRRKKLITLVSCRQRKLITLVSCRHLWYFNPSTLKSAKIFFFKPRDQRVFSIWNHHKCLSQLFPVHLNGLPMLLVYNH